MAAAASVAGELHPHRRVMHMLAALDLATGRLLYLARKRWIEFLELLKVLRSRWPGQKLYVGCDNFSPHHHARVGPGARRTGSSWCSCIGRWMSSSDSQDGWIGAIR